MGARLFFLIVVFSLGYSALLFRLYDVQVTNGTYYQAQASSRYVSSSFLNPRRGSVYFTDKDGALVAAALNKEFPDIYTVPNDVSDASEAAHFLAPLLGVTVTNIEEKLLKKDDPFEPLAYKVTDEVVSKIRDAKLKGIYIDTVYQRFYPFGDLASHILGYVGPLSDGPGKKGYYGIEAYYDEHLMGTPGRVDDGEIVNSIPGDDIQLTIDPTIQTEAERVLVRLVEKYNAKSGNIIVQDPLSGKILALASRPTFDPNEYSKYSISTFLNPTAQAIYEPGSVLKVLTMAAGIDAGVITPDTTYYDSGSLTLNGRTIRNWDGKANGTMTMTNVLEKSLNTGAVFAQQELGREKFKEYFSAFGLDRKTDIEIRGEVAGDLGRLNPSERDIAFATAAYGQGIAMTPLQLIRAMSAIANGGKIMRPYMNARTGAVYESRVISEDTATKVTNMMVSAVKKARVADISGYNLAGKTGTAYVPDFIYGGYTNNVINTFVGFGPTTNPQFTILIKLDEPAGNPLASLTVVPTFRDLAQFILNYYEIPPDNLQ